MHKALFYSLLVQSALLLSAEADFLAGQNVVDRPLEILSTLSDIKGVDTSASNFSTDVFVAQIFFKNWPLFNSINGSGFSIGEIEFEWIVSIDVDGNLDTGTKAPHPFPGSDYEVRARRIKELGPSMDSTIGPNIMSSQLWEYVSSSNNFVAVPTVFVVENSFSVPENSINGAPSIHWFRMQCPVPGLAANSRLGVQTYHRIPPFFEYRDYTEQNAGTYLPFIKTITSLDGNDFRLRFENLAPQVRYGVSSSSDLKKWNLVDQVFIDKAGETTTLVKSRVAGSRFYRAAILPD
jgi:hypothetical protein